MGEKHNTRRTAWILTFLVVVSHTTRKSLTFGFINTQNHLLLQCNSVFWDLYCAAPERREQCDHSSEAKAFHDYVSDCEQQQRKTEIAINANAWYLISSLGFCEFRIRRQWHRSRKYWYYLLNFNAMKWRQKRKCAIGWFESLIQIERWTCT